MARSGATDKRMADMTLVRLFAVSARLFLDHHRTLLAATALVCLPFFAIYVLAVYAQHVRQAQQAAGL
ncbi:MAG: hypothetical protein ACOCWR_00050 [Oceanidesulfovibrio sp.]